MMPSGKKHCRLLVLNKASPPNLLSHREEALQLCGTKHHIYQILLLNMIKHFQRLLNKVAKDDVEDMMLINLMKYRSFSVGEGGGG